MVQIAKQVPGTLPICQKASQSLPPAGGKSIEIIFCRGVYLAKNTSQSASVEFVRLWRTNYARGRLQAFCPKWASPILDRITSPRRRRAGDLLFYSMLCAAVGVGLFRLLPLRRQGPHPDFHDPPVLHPGDGARPGRRPGSGRPTSGTRPDLLHDPAGDGGGVALLPASRANRSYRSSRSAEQAMR